jgi:hypothetical protein
MTMSDARELAKLVHRVLFNMEDERFADLVEAGLTPQVDLSEESFAALEEVAEAVREVVSREEQEAANLAVIHAVSASQT